MEYWVVVGLGNPGKEYEMTRHNIGEIVVRSLANRHRFPFVRDKKLGVQVAQGEIDATHFYFVLPAGYMNESGKGVKRYLDARCFPVERFLVVVDDADISFGEVRLRPKGGTGGHRGLKSIQQLIGTSEYPRMRIGIGREKDGQELRDHVLEKFSREEIDRLPCILEKALEALEMLGKASFPNVMNWVNSQEKIKKQSLPEGG